MFIETIEVIWSQFQILKCYSYNILIENTLNRLCNILYIDSNTDFNQNFDPELITIKAVDIL